LFIYVNAKPKSVSIILRTDIFENQSNISVLFLGKSLIKATIVQ